MVDETSERADADAAVYPFVGASPSGEDFVIETIEESEQITTTQQAVPLMPLPALPPSPVAPETDISSKLIRWFRELRAGTGRASTGEQQPMVNASARAR